MHFDFSDEQRMLGESVERFIKNSYSFEQRQAIIQSEAGYSREVWQQMAELGILALQVPEEYGGLAPAPAEALLTLTALGSAALVEPYISSAIVATALLRELGSDAQKQRLLPAMASGETIAVLAHYEPGARWDRSHVKTRAVGGKLTGMKTVVLHAPAADVILVSAKTDQGVRVFVVPAQKLAMKAYRTVDGQVAADLELDALDGAELLEGEASGAIDRALDLGIAAVCAEAVGALQVALTSTVQYTKERKQFGVPIAKFQALQHRMADMLMHVELARSMSILAMMKMDARSLAAAKVVVGQACRFVGEQAVQLHGGMGMTDELAISHVFKRLYALELVHGDADHHLDRFSQMNLGQ